MSYSTRTALAVGLGLLTILALPVDVHADEHRRVVRVYGAPTTDLAGRTEAIRIAAALLKDAGIEGDWRDCGVGGADVPCLTVRAPGDLVVRIAPTFVAGTKMPDGSISTRRAPGEPAQQLGFASFDARTRAGVLATIFHDRVMTVAQRAKVDYRDLLGRAIAHEVGHLILRGGGHGRSGLMRGVWTDTELTEDRHDDWVFSPEERTRLRAAVAH